MHHWTLLKILLSMSFHMENCFESYNEVVFGGVTDSKSLLALLEFVPKKYLSALLECLATTANMITSIIMSTTTATSTTITIPNVPSRGEVSVFTASVAPFTRDGVVGGSPV